MSQPVKIMIVEDEGIVAMDLAMRLRNEGYEVTGMASDSDEAMTLFSSSQPDLVLMDININGSKDGIETAKQIKRMQEVPVIFLTAFSQSEYVNRAKEVNPAGYLVKPFNTESLFTSIQIAIHNFALVKNAIPAPGSAPAANFDESNKEPVLFFNNYFFVKNNYRFVKVALADFLFAESDNNYIHLITRQQKITLRISLQAFAESIHHQFLVRVHRGYVVNIQNVDSFSEESLMIGKHKIPVGRTYKDDFLKSFNYL